MALRALGMKPGDEVALQVDTCSATAFAVMNAGATPVFSDISPDTFMLPTNQPSGFVLPSTKAVLATHMWGNAENVEALRRTTEQHGIPLIEDACLALGTVCAGRKAGVTGKVGIFSFGCLKPIQGGEGGMLVTNDDALARELRSLRHWGDRTIDFGVRDTTQLAWNGRMSEVVAAVVGEQLKGFPRHLLELRERVSEFQKFLGTVDGMQINFGAATSLQDCSFTQVVVRIDPSRLGMTARDLRGKLDINGIVNWYANFEKIPSLSFFAKDTWKDWVLRGRIDAIRSNYHARFVEAERVATDAGIGFPKQHFTSKARLRYLIERLKVSLSRE